MSVETKSSENFNQDQGFVDLLSIIWGYKTLVCALTSLFVVISIVIALLMPNIYRSEVIVSPAASMNSNSLNSLSSQFGGIASLAGLSLPSSGSVDKVSLAIEIIKSREFINNFVEKYKILPQLLAVSSWDRESNKLQYDFEIYNPDEKVWIAEEYQKNNKAPSENDSYKKFREILSITRMKDSSLIKIAIKHESPYVAQTWVKAIVYEINQVMKNRDLIEAQKSINYLTKEIEKTNISNMRSILHSLVQEHTKTIMMANVREQYVFEVIDPAYLPEEKSEPKRFLIVILGLVIGLILSSMIAVVISIFMKEKP
ncbi:MAG: LPS O-antigen length regulator [Pseudoalteromonas sp.]|nr:LPS O-antigen length regulator [Pseudoalteromonas sp.]